MGYCLDPEKEALHRKRISEALANKPKPAGTVESIRKGRVKFHLENGTSPSTRKAMSLGQLRRWGSSNEIPNHQGTEYDNWRYAVYERDKDTCQRCGKINLVGRERQAHHIFDWITYPYKRYDISNGETLCFACHLLVEKEIRSFKRVLKESGMLSLQEVQEIYILAVKELMPSLQRRADKDLIAKWGASKLEDAVCQLIDYVEAGCSRPLTKNEYTAITVHILRSLKGYLESISIPFTVNTVVTHVHMLGFAMDRAFPGYASAGFLRSIIYPDRIVEETPIDLPQLQFKMPMREVTQAA